MPFLFRDSAQMDCVLDNHLTKVTADLLAKRGVQMLGWNYVDSALNFKPDDIPRTEVKCAVTAESRRR